MEIYVKCSREKEEIFRQKSVKFSENKVGFQLLLLFIRQEANFTIILQEGSESVSSSCDMLKPLQLSQTAICIDGAQYLSGCHPVSDLN